MARANINWVGYLAVVTSVLTLCIAIQFRDQESRISALEEKVDQLTLQLEVSADLGFVVQGVWWDGDTLWAHYVTETTVCTLRLERKGYLWKIAEITYDSRS